MFFSISNRTYDILKWLVMILFPAFAVFYGTMAETLGLPMGPEVIATVGAITVFLGAYLQMNMVMYARFTGDSSTPKYEYPFAMSSDLYDLLKWLVKVGLPGLGVVYLSLANTWGFAYADIVPVVASAVALFLGTILQISAQKRTAFANET